MNNDVWEAVSSLEGKSVMGSHWIYKTKHGVDGRIEKFKEIFVAKGFSQVEGIDCDETFVSMARYSSMRTFIAIAANMGWKIHQMDIKKMFLNGVIKDIYIAKPKRFETCDKEIHM